MQIHANSKGKLAWDDITLWANHSMKCHWKNHFTFFDSALCKWGWIFHSELHSVTPAAFQPNIWSAGNNHRSFVHKIWTLYSAYIPQIWRDAKSLKWWPCATDTWSFEPQMNWLWETVKDYNCARFQVIPVGGFSFILLTYTHEHTLWQSDCYIHDAILCNQWGKITQSSCRIEGMWSLRKLVPWGTDGRLPLSGDIRSLIVE